MEPGERPGDEDADHRQLGELGGLVPAEAHELDADQTNTSAKTSTKTCETMRNSAFAARPELGHTSTSKCVLSRTPIIAPIMTIQMNRKRAISSVQI